MRTIMFQKPTEKSNQQFKKMFLNQYPLHSSRVKMIMEFSELERRVRLSKLEMTLYIVLKEFGLCTLSNMELSRIVNSSPASISQVLKRLEEREFIIIINKDRTNKRKIVFMGEGNARRLYTNR